MPNKKTVKYDGSDTTKPVTDRLPEDGNFTAPISQTVRELALAHLRRMGLHQDFDPASRVPDTPKPAPSPTPPPSPNPRSIPNDRKIYGQGSELSDSYDGTSYDATTPSPTDANNTGSGGSPFSNYGQNLGQGINPWDNTWGNVGGAYSAPMDPHAAQGMDNISGYANSGMGLNSSNNMLNDELTGQYLTTNTNPYLAQIQKGMQGQKDSQDALEQRRIGSSMAAGGNALSGARAEQESRYQNLSDANFNTSMGNLLSQNYQNERGLQSKAADQANNNAKTQMGGYQAEMNSGMVPTQMAQDDINRQYNDWVRSTQGMYNDYTQGGKTYAQLMAGQPGSYQPTYGDSQATSLAGLISQLLGGGKSSGKPSSGSSGGGPGGSGAGTNGSTAGDNGMQNYGDQHGTDDNGNPVYVGQNGNLMYSDGTDVPSGLMSGSNDNGDQGMQDPNAYSGDFGLPNDFGGDGGSSPIIDYGNGGYDDSSGDYGNGF